MSERVRESWSCYILRERTMAKVLWCHCRISGSGRLLRITVDLMTAALQMNLEKLDEESS